MTTVSLTVTRHFGWQCEGLCGDVIWELHLTFTRAAAFESRFMFDISSFPLLSLLN